MAQTQVTDVLGRVRDVQRTWPDGSWECPFCGYGFSAERGLCRGQKQGYREDCGNGEHCHYHRRGIEPMRAITNPMRFYVVGEKPALVADRDLKRLAYERKLDIFNFPGTLLETALRLMPRVQVKEAVEIERNIGDAPTEPYHLLRIDIYAGPDFGEREEFAFTRSIEDRLRAVAELHVRNETYRRRLAEFEDRVRDVPRRARLGGGNAHQRRVRRRSILRAVEATRPRW